MKKITIKDVAKKAGVAPSTVTNALKPESRKVSSAKREMILKIIDEMGYVPDMNAQGIAAKYKKRVGFFLRSPGKFKPGHINTELMHYINKSAYDNNVELINIIIPSNNEDYVKEVEYRIRSYKITDLIIYGLDANHEMINILSKLDINKIFVEIPVNDKLTHFISTDNYKMQYEMTRKIINTYSIDKMLYITGNLDAYVSQERLKAVKNFTSKYKVNVDIIEATFEYIDTLKALEKIDLTLYDYISCGSDDMLIPVGELLNGKNHYPILSGFDDNVPREVHNYKVYTIDQNMELLAENVIKMFKEQLYFNELIEGEIKEY